MLEATADNDILIKCACYRWSAELANIYNQSIGILGTARFVVRSRLERRNDLNDKLAALEDWASLLACAEALEPTEAEVELATDIEDAAQAANLELDAGESQLCAITITRGIGSLVTGDKRAIVAIEHLMAPLPSIVALSGKVLCLEQFAAIIAARSSVGAVRSAVCAEPSADTALTICCECRHGGDLTELVGLASYIADLRSKAPAVLAHDLGG